jgi:hypothetical protein
VSSLLTGWERDDGTGNAEPGPETRAYLKFEQRLWDSQCVLVVRSCFALRTGKVRNNKEDFGTERACDFNGRERASAARLEPVQIPT